MKTQKKAGETWADESLKLVATLAYLATRKKKELDTAIAEHVDEYDGYLSDAMRAFLLSYPLDSKALSTITDLRRAYTASDGMEVIMSVIPQFDGEADPFGDVRSWTDLAKLPALEQLNVDGNGVLPGTELANHPSLAKVMVSLPDDARSRKALAKLVAESGFEPDELWGSWVILKRNRKSGSAGALMLVLDQHIPRGGYKKGKSFQLDLLGAKLAKGQIRASFRLYMRDAMGSSEPEQLGEVDVLPVKGTETTLKANGKKLATYIEQHRKLPSSL
ncbi:MAG: hypothetical protein QM817_04900 [Archangium sp.]